jgi:hypothetical protein
MDYIFYRIYTHYKSKDHIPIMMGVYFLFVLELSLFFFVGVVFNFISGGVMSKQGIGLPLFWSIYIGTLLMFFILTLRRYLKKNRVRRLVERFENNPLNEYVNDWQIFILPVLIVFFAVGVIITFSR